MEISDNNFLLVLQFSYCEKCFSDITYRTLSAKSHQYYNLFKFFLGFDNLI